MRLAGAVVALLGVAVAGRSALLLAGRGRPVRGPRPVFVLAGPYLRLRNPLLGGLLVGLAGVALAAGSWRLLALAVAAAAAAHAWVVRVEEPRLRTRFGAAYAAYLARVPRWLPGPRVRDAAALALLAGCLASPALAAAPPLTIRRTGCFGSCPSYDLALHADGTVRWLGRGYVAAKGERTARLGGGRVRAYLAELARIGFFGLDDRYDNGLVDLPALIVTARVGSHTKTVTCRGDCPALLTALVERIEHAAHVARWVGPPRAPGAP